MLGEKLFGRMHKCYTLWYTRTQAGAGAGGR